MKANNETRNKKGFFGIGIYHPKTEENVGTLWRAAYLYGADFIFTIGRRYSKQASDTVDAPRHIPLYNYLTFEDFQVHAPIGAQLVCLELTANATMLNNFAHPKQAIYLLGAEDYGIPKEICKKHMTVQIPAVAPFSMNVAMSGSIAMYDRFVKSL